MRNGGTRHQVRPKKGRGKAEVKRNEGEAKLTFFSITGRKVPSETATMSRQI
jgi:hypothetical protein